MIVLSVGMETSPEMVELANNLGIELTEGNFCETTNFKPCCDIPKRYIMFAVLSGTQGYSRFRHGSQCCSL